METFRFFVYGTLMSDGSRNNVINGGKFIKKAKTTNNYALLDLGQFPGLVRVENDGRVVEGELWEVHTTLIPRLDQIEAAPRMYRMESIQLDGEDELAYTYFYKLRTKETKIYQEERWKN